MFVYRKLTLQQGIDVLPIGQFCFFVKLTGPASGRAAGFPFGVVGGGTDEGGGWAKFYSLK